MKLYPFITWYPEDKSVVRGHGLGEDVYYLSGNRPARYPVPAIRYAFEPGIELLFGDVVLLFWKVNE